MLPSRFKSKQPSFQFWPTCPWQQSCPRRYLLASDILLFSYAPALVSKFVDYWILSSSCIFIFTWLQVHGILYPVSEQSLSKCPDLSVSPNIYQFFVFIYKEKSFGTFLWKNETQQEYIELFRFEHKVLLELLKQYGANRKGKKTMSESLHVSTDGLLRYRKQMEISNNEWKHGSQKVRQGRHPRLPWRYSFGTIRAGTCSEAHFLAWPVAQPFFSFISADCKLTCMCRTNLWTLDKLSVAKINCSTVATEHATLDDQARFTKDFFILGSLIPGLGTQSASRKACLYGRRGRSTHLAAGRQVIWEAFTKSSWLSSFTSLVRLAETQMQILRSYGATETLWSLSEDHN